jgi:ABC-2 type transport system permease protein
MSDVPEVIKKPDAAALQSGASRRRVSGEPEQRRTLHPLAELTLTRVREFVREPEVIFWVFIFPVLLACALGIAFRNTAPEKVRVAVEGDVGGANVSQVVGALAKSEDVEPVVLGHDEAALALRTGNVALVVRVAATGSEISDLRSQILDPALVYRYDPTRPESRTAKLAVDDALWRANSTNRDSQAGPSRSAAEGLNANENTAAQLPVREETVTEPGARYIDFLIPGLIGLNLMGSGMWGLGFAIVSARGKKLLKRFAATPMRRSHYLLSFMLSRLIFLALEVAALVGFAWLVFGVVVRGSLLDVAVCAVAGALAFSGLGLLVAARPRTVEGVSGLMNFVMLPMWLLSGTFFSAARFPQWFQPIIKALPLTALNDILRAVMNDGAPLVSHWVQLAIVMGWGLLSFIVAMRIFRWQ